MKVEDELYYLKNTLHDLIEILTTQNIQVYSRYLVLLDLGVPRAQLMQLDTFFGHCNQHQVVPTLEAVQKKFYEITGLECARSVIKEILLGYQREDLIPILHQMDLRQG